MGINAVGMAQQRTSPFERMLTTISQAKGLYDQFRDSSAKAAATTREAELAKQMNNPNSPEMEFVRTEAKKYGVEVGPLMTMAKFKDSPLASSIEAYRKSALERENIGYREGEERKTKLATAGQKAPKGYEWKVDPATGERTLSASIKALPADKVLSVNEGNSIPNMLVDIKDTIQNNDSAFGPIVGRVNSMNPWDEQAQTIDSQMRAASQAFGRYMEGGVLRKEDEDKYRKMFPTLSDTPKVAQNKLAIVERLLATKQNSNVGALKDSGYDVAGVNKPLNVPGVPKILSGGGKGPSGGLLGTPAIAGPGDSKPTPEDMSALQWAKQNPNDPRAGAIMQQLRIKGFR